VTLGSVDTAARRAADYAGPALLVLGATAATYSVVRYDGRIVATYTVLTLVLAASLIRAPRLPRPASGALGRLPAAVALGLAGISIVLVPGFTYLSGSQASATRWIPAAGALLAAVLLTTLPRRGADAAFAVALAAYTLTGFLVIRWDTAPRIDVWYTLQGAADAIAAGHNIYSEVWTAPTGIMESFTYLPWTAMMLAPGRWFFGDVRWALMAVTILAAFALRGLRRRTPPTGTDLSRSDRPGTTGAAAAALLLLLPGTTTMVEQAWTEPVLLLGIVVAARAWQAHHPWPATLFLGMAMASKQHLALLIPVLIAWPRFGFRRTVAVVSTAGVLMLPWFLADPAAMWHDTVHYLVNFPPIRFSDTLFIAAQRELSWTPPFWVTGAIVISTVAGTAWAVHRRNPGIGELLRWAALVLLVANLVNKQAFYNQFWLVGALLVASWAFPADPADPRPGTTTTPAERPADAAA
jgi:hypothetical protein